MGFSEGMNLIETAPMQDGTIIVVAHERLGKHTMFWNGRGKDGKVRFSPVFE